MRQSRALGSLAHLVHALSLFVLLFCTFFTREAMATHFRYGTYSWTRESSVTGDPTGMTVVAYVEQAYRMSYYGQQSVGSVVDIWYFDNSRGWNWGDGV